jgi:hypothetical protein
MTKVSSLFQKIKLTFSWERFAAGLLLLLGFGLRLRQFLTGRSLWLDESMLALNIVELDFIELFGTLKYDQGAPIGFLQVEKLLYSLLGENEFVLRIFPFAVGIFGLGMFYLLLRRTTSGFGLLTGLALFAVGSELIYYSSEVKQYTLDVAISVTMLYLAFPLFEGRGEKRRWICLWVAGIFAFWFSHPALFVLAGIGFTLLVQALQERDRSKIGRVIMLGVTWVANLGLLYLVSLRYLTQNTFLREYWQENFIPVPPWADWEWFGTFFGGLLRDQLGITVFPWLVFILVVLGSISLFNKNKAYASAILAIFFFAAVASSLWLYPLGGRFSLFMVPAVIIFIGQAVDTLEHRLQAQFNWSSLVAFLVGAYLVYAPIVESFSYYRDPKYYEHIRPTMDMLADNWQEGDDLFVSYGAMPAFRFYAPRYGLGEVSYQASFRTDYLEPTKMLSYFEPLDGESRVWILISHVYERGDFNEKDYLLSYLDTIGKKKREFRSPGTSVYLFLYDLGSR